MTLSPGVPGGQAHDQAVSGQSLLSRKYVWPMLQMGWRTRLELRSVLHADTVAVKRICRNVCRESPFNFDCQKKWIGVIGGAVEAADEWPGFSAGKELR